MTAARQTPDEVARGMWAKVVRDGEELALGVLLICGEGALDAMDMVVGRALLDGELPLHGRILCVSGRLSFGFARQGSVNVYTGAERVRAERMEWGIAPARAA
jgi:hypothetical protein